MRYLLTIAFVSSACAALPDDGALICNANPAHACPDGFACATDNRCYRTGHAPDLGAGANDLGSDDLATSDMASCVPATGSQSSGCPSSDPICGSDGVCHGCVAHGECTLDVCKPDGSCASSSEIAYVDNTSANCSDVAHTSTPAAPYCQIQGAIDAAGGFPFVRVAASTTSYQPLVLVSETIPIDITLVGPGRNLSGPNIASIKDQAKPAITIQTTVTQPPPLSLTLDGIYVAGGNVGTNDSIFCSSNGAVALALRNSIVAGATAIGLELSGCSLTMDRSIVFANQGDGIKFAGAKLSITNSFIRGNGSLGASTVGVEIDSFVAPSLFAFNTVQGNAADSSSVGGIVCPNTPFLIQSSIVAGNSLNNGSQIAGSCVLQNVVTGTDNFAGATQLTPAFVSTTDPHLVANDPANVACCIDKVAGPTTANADHDIDATHRPRGAAWDIGAHEVQ